MTADFPEQALCAYAQAYANPPDFPTVMTLDPPSPCTGTCAIDPVSSLCRGCARTIDEIMAWPAASAMQKHAILGRLAARRQRTSVRSK